MKIEHSEIFLLLKTHTTLDFAPVRMGTYAQTKFVISFLVKMSII